MHEPNATINFLYSLFPIDSVVPRELRNQSMSTLELTVRTFSSTVARLTGDPEVPGSTPLVP